MSPLNFSSIIPLLITVIFLYCLLLLQIFLSFFLEKSRYLVFFCVLVDYVYPARASWSKFTQATRFWLRTQRLFFISVMLSPVIMMFVSHHQHIRLIWKRPWKLLRISLISILNLNFSRILPCGTPYFYCRKFRIVTRQLYNVT